MHFWLNVISFSHNNHWGDAQDLFVIINYVYVCVCVFKMEEELFNPDYVEVDRVLEVSYCEDKDSREVAIAL